jgi:hypothetical protein
MLCGTALYPLPHPTPLSVPFKSYSFQPTQLHTMAALAPQLRPESTVFVTLTPSNISAKRAFHDLADLSLKQTEEKAYHLRFMHIRVEKSFDKEVAAAWNKTDVEPNSDESTEPDTDTEPRWKEDRSIWTGYYFFDFEPRPKGTSTWTVGKGRDDPTGVELKLSTTHSARDRQNGVHGKHAQFYFSPTTGFLCIAKRAGLRAELSRNGKSLSGVSALNQDSIQLRIGNLEYNFQYTDYARTSKYENRRAEFVTAITTKADTQMRLLTPTPLPNARQVDRWTLGKPLGRGAAGKVYVATTSRNDIAAVKIMDRRDKRSAQQVEAEVSTLQALTKLAKGEDFKNILQLKDVIYESGSAQFDPKRFGDVFFVLEPCASFTFYDLIQKQGQLDKLRLFREALLAVQFMHSHGYMHRDIKPANIGIYNLAAPSTVLLDLGCAVNPASGQVMPTPGCLGTINYLAPEMEREPYTASVDVWALGVVGFELIFGSNPWPFHVNPWRSGSDYNQSAVFKEIHRRNAQVTAGQLTACG